MVPRHLAEHHDKLAQQRRQMDVPIGGGPGKAFTLGDLSLKLDLDAYYNAIRPKADQDTWLLQVTLTLAFPK
jgi:hypothetical protein